MDSPIAIVGVAIVAVALLFFLFKYIGQVSASRAQLAEEKLQIDSKDPGHVIANVFGGIFGGLQ